VALPAKPDGTPLFRETQRLLENRWAVVTSVLGAAACFAVILTALAWGALPPPLAVLVLLAGATIPLLLLARLETEVHGDALHVRFVPLTRRHRFAWSEIARAYARSYRPLREYGGWGIRWGPKGRAYNVSGDRGVQLELADGRRLLIGSRRADELADAIRRARAAVGPSGA
jgi:hypothetical protein